MDSVLNLLKQEINATTETGHDLAKWKLVVTAALGVTALGLVKESSPNYRLLLLVPFVCVYIDLYAYQLQLRVSILARFLREHPAEDPGLLQKYEDWCEKLRNPRQRSFSLPVFSRRFFSLHVFSLEDWAGFGCSVVVSACGPIFYIAQHWDDRGLLSGSHWRAGMIWAVGVVLIVILFWYSRRELEKLRIGSSSSQAAAAWQEPSARSLC
jgi:hypothetical protein